MIDKLTGKKILALIEDFSIEMDFPSNRKTLKKQVRNLQECVCELYPLDPKYPTNLKKFVKLYKKYTGATNWDLPDWLYAIS